MEFIHLAGSEDVRTASSEMVSAAQEMQKAASEISFALDRFMEFWREDIAPALAAIREEKK